MENEKLKDIKRDLQLGYTRNLHRLLYDGVFHDIHLLYPGSNERIPSVKTLLAAQSGFFQDMFFGHGIERDADGNVKLLFSEHIPFHIFKVLHNFIFTLKLDIEGMSLDDQFQLFRLANYYQFDDVIRYMIDHFLEMMSSESVWPLVNLATEFNNAQIGNECAQFISQRIGSFSKNLNFLSLHLQPLAFLLMRNTFYHSETDIFKAAKAWHEKHPDEDPTLLKNAIRISLAKSDDQILMREWGVPLSEDRRHRYLIPKDPIKDESEYYYDKVKVISPDGRYIQSVSTALAHNIPLETIVTMRDVFLLNHIRIEFSAPMLIQYKINVSADRENWTLIVDYHEYTCQGHQDIYFAPRAFKYIRIEARNLIRTQIRQCYAEDDPSSSPIFMNIENLVMENTNSPKEMTSHLGGFLIPDFNIAPRCAGPGTGKGTNSENLTVDCKAKIEDKYRRLFRGNMDKDDNGEYLLHLPQPCQISFIKFLIYDRISGQTGTQRRYHYRIENSFDKENWNVIIDKSSDDEGYVGTQEIYLNPPQLLLYIKIVPIKIFNFNIRRIFSIVDFQCYGTVSSED